MRRRKRRRVAETAFTLCDEVVRRTTRFVDLATHARMARVWRAVEQVHVPSRQAIGWMRLLDRINHGSPCDALYARLEVVKKCASLLCHRIAIDSALEALSVLRENARESPTRALETLLAQQSANNTAQITGFLDSRIGPEIPDGSLSLCCVVHCLCETPRFSRAAQLVGRAAMSDGWSFWFEDEPGRHYPAVTLSTTLGVVEWVTGSMAQPDILTLGRGRTVMLQFWNRTPICTEYTGQMDSDEAKVLEHTLHRFALAECQAFAS